MASTIQLKTGTGSAVPSSLTQGEVAINVDNGLIYYGSGSVNSVKQLDAFTNITASVISASGHIFAERIAIGDGDSSFAGQLTVEEDIVANRNITGDNQTAILGIKQIISNDFISGSRLISHTHITASNNISASGEIIGNKIFGNLIGGKTDGSGIVLGSASDIHVTASGNISASLNSKIFASSASFGGASFLRAFNVKGAGLDGRLNLQGTAGTDNPGIEFTVNDNTSRALIRLDQVGTNGTALEFFTEPDGGDIANTLTIGHTGHITASGNISSSGQVIANEFILNTNTNAIQFKASNGTLFSNIITNAIDDFIVQNLKNGENLRLRAGQSGDKGKVLIQQGGTSTNIAEFGPTDSIHFTGNITASGNISSSGTLIVQKNQFSKTSNTDADHQGDVVFFGATTSMTAGKIYYYNSSGNWAETDADAEASAKGLLAVALGTASDTNGMLLRGTVTLNHDPGGVGDVLYLSTTAGQASSTVPSGNGDIVRIIGYCLDASNGQIWFNPDNTFVEVNA